MANILVCDVDGVVVDVSYHWYEHIMSLHDDPQAARLEFPFKDVSLEYDYSKFSPHWRTKEALDFWKSPDLYDDAPPLEAAVDVLREVVASGIQLVFCSHVEGHHAKSKFFFLKDYFPFMHGFVATREKNFVRASGVVDDLTKHLLSFPDTTHKFLYSRPHNSGEVHSDVKIISSWSDMADSGMVDDFIRMLKEVHV